MTTPPNGYADDFGPELDEELITLLVRRVARARRQQGERLAAGLPATALSAENAMVRRYVSRLGAPGAEIARAVLALSRSACELAGAEGPGQDAEGAERPGHGTGQHAEARPAPESARGAHESGGPAEMAPEARRKVAAVASYQLAPESASP